MHIHLSIANDSKELAEPALSLTVVLQYFASFVKKNLWNCTVRLTNKFLGDIQSTGHLWSSGQYSLRAHRGEPQSCWLLILKAQLILAFEHERLLPTNNSRGWRLMVVPPPKHGRVETKRKTAKILQFLSISNRNVWFWNYARQKTSFSAYYIFSFVQNFYTTGGGTAEWLALKHFPRGIHFQSF